MTAEALLQSLRRERDQLSAAIAFIEAHLGNGARRGKATAILESIAPVKTKRGPYKTKKAKGLHWTQTAAGKKKMARIQKAAWARKRAETI